MKQGWEIKTVKDCLTKVIDNRGKTPPLVDSITSNCLLEINSISGGGKFPNYSVSKKYVSDETYSSWFRSGHPQIDDILFATVGTIGEVAILNENRGCIAQNLIALRVDKKRVHPQYLYYHLKSPIVKNVLLNLNISTVQPSIRVPHFLATKIPLPSLSVQQRIVSILDEAFINIDIAKANTEKNLKNAVALFESELQRVFSDQSNGWLSKPLGELATFRNGMNYTKSSKGEVIKIAGVKDFKDRFWVPFEDLDSFTIDGKLNEIDILKEGDIIAVRSNGNPELIGRTLLAGNIAGKVSHSGFTIRIRLNSNIISPIYLCRYLKTSKTRKELVDSGNGVGIRSLNQGSLSSLIIPFPKSLKDQQTIVSKLDALREQTKKLEAVYEKKLQDLEELKKSVLSKAFSGEL